MIVQNIRISALILTTAGLGLFVYGCEKSAPAKAEASTIEARLAKADAVDGKTDKVVTKCAGCALGMDGKAEHSLTAHGYTLHLCSAHCKEDFGKDVDKSLMAMELPE